MYLNNSANDNFKKHNNFSLELLAGVAFKIINNLCYLCS